MLRIEDLRPGNEIMYDHEEYRERPLPLFTADVRKILGDRIELSNDEIRHISRCSGVQITRPLLEKRGYYWEGRGFKCDQWVNTWIYWHDGWRIVGPDGEKPVTYWHELQNFNEDIKVI